MLIQIKKIGFLAFLLVVLSCLIAFDKPITLWKEPFTGMEFVLIPKGTFYMGNPNVLDDDQNFEKQHLVTISKDFWLGRMEVTQEQWNKVMGDRELHPEKPNPFRTDNPKYPVVSVSYFDVETFLRKLETLSPGNRFRLPTEAEWEYACRAGTTTNYSFGDSISLEQVNFKDKRTGDFIAVGRAGGHPQAVGSYSPNSWGLYDMHGNVWEWVSDWYAPYPIEKVTDPMGPNNGKEKVMRGGSWYFNADHAKSYYRGTHPPQLWGFSIGFRIVCEKIFN